MKISTLVRQLLPEGSDAFAFTTEEDERAIAEGAVPACPTWPPDLFAVAGRIVELSGCYTLASPPHGNVEAHRSNLESLRSLIAEWSSNPMVPPEEVAGLWHTLVGTHGDVYLNELEYKPEVASCALRLFAIADEACKGMGWGDDGTDPTITWFTQSVLYYMTGAGQLDLLLPYSLCCKVPAELVVVLPKAITASVGCTIRSLSHFLALLPATSVIETSWTLPFGRTLEEGQAAAKDPYDMRLLLVPFPFKVPAQSFTLASPREKIADNHYWPAYFGLDPLWLASTGSPITGEQLANELVRPLLDRAEKEVGKKPHGIVFPECALSLAIAEELVAALADTGIEFVVAGVLHEENGKTYNRACTFVIRPEEDGAAKFIQNKHHRWRLDRTQAERYALAFDSDPDNDKWWEAIDVSRRTLPVFGLRKEMSFCTLICEDLARADPAMPVIRAMGPNLVIALLMDGPQLAVRWPGKYATVLAEDPGSAVLTFTCAGLLDRSNWVEARPVRSVGLWRDAGGKTQEIALPEGAGGIILTLQSKRKHQSTLDLRSDGELSRQLSLRSIVPVFLDEWPAWA